MSRPTRIQTYMGCAALWAQRSTCHRLNVGAVIVVDRTIVAHGYNGVPAGYPHCSGNDCPGRLVCKETIHAEQNAIERWRDTAGFELSKSADIYCTDSPCEHCSQLIKRNGIKRVFFAQPYRITTSIDWLANDGIEVYRVTPAGYVIEWLTKNVVNPEV